MKQEILQMAEAAGAKMRITPAERLTQPPSADPKFLMPGARSVIALLMPLDGDIIRQYLAGQDQLSYTKHESAVNARIHTLAEQIAGFLQSKGHQSMALPTNYNYRYLVERRHRNMNPQLLRRILNWLSSPSGKTGQVVKRQFVLRFILPQIKRQDWDLLPTFSHRYAAVAAGLGCIGWSGNLVSPFFGARVVLDSVITDAEIPEDSLLNSSHCDGCRICVSACQSGYISLKDSQQTTIFDKPYIHNHHGHNIRCTFVCGGLSGQSRYPEWATWSPGRVQLPDSDKYIKEWFEGFIVDNFWRGNMYSGMIRDLFLMSNGQTVKNSRATCNFCRLVCWQTREERQENYRLIRTAGARLTL